MGRQKGEAAYVQVLELSDLVRQISSERQLYKMRYKGGTLDRVATELTSLIVKDLDFGMVNLRLKEKISRKALHFAMGVIMMDLKRYNLLWHYDSPADGNTKEILAELKEQEVIFQTEVTGIYIVNPVLIWRGDIHSSVEATKRALRNNGKVPSMAVIRDLQPPKNHELVPMDLMEKFNGAQKNTGMLRLEDENTLENE